MAEKENRVRNLSTRWLNIFKVVVLMIYTTLAALITYSLVSRGDNIVSAALGLLNAAIYVYFFYRLMRVTAKLYRVEFDEDYLYVLNKKQDLLIPLENIESVEIATLGGVYKVNLYHPDQIGDHFYLKLSLWYPLNYPSRDALVNVLRSYIKKASARRPHDFQNTLPS